jgi:hypothetical protein
VTPGQLRDHRLGQASQGVVDRVADVSMVDVDPITLDGIRAIAPVLMELDRR